MRPDADIPIRTVRNLARNPNLGGQALVIGLGCEMLQPEQIVGEGDGDLDLDERWLYRLQDSQHGFGEMIEQIMALAERRLHKLDRGVARRCPASAWWWACSAAAAMPSPASRRTRPSASASDLLVRAGATVMFSEVTEVRDAVHLLSARRQERGGGAGLDPRDGLVRPLPRAGPQRPQREHLAGQQGRRPVQHRGEGARFRPPSPADRRSAA